MTVPQVSPLPPRPIRAVALCLFRHGDRILVEEHEDSVKRDRFCRPIGGGIEFGERSDAALIREIQEELGAEIEDLRLVSVLENVFVYGGVPSHEIDFIYNAQFTDKTRYERNVMSAYEHGNDGHFTVRWRSLAEMDAANLRLVPDALRSILEQG